jgi:hypothetical protein
MIHAFRCGVFCMFVIPIPHTDTNGQRFKDVSVSSVARPPLTFILTPQPAFLHKHLNLFLTTTFQTTETHFRTIAAFSSLVLVEKKEGKYRYPYIRKRRRRAVKSVARLF